MATAEEAIAGVLEETIEALTSLDLERLILLEERTLQLVASGAEIHPTFSLLEKRAVLKYTLEETRTNLDALERLRSGKEQERWEL
ncbi:hypothetical protein [Edaphobacter albus]|uniref:hypothetical protein n=1 Tax=Edaphobacter sp. 4G125 TaxID=2763071 RepID=UPI0016474EFE|nr:hypothetical protein [Edaphobacter sp. 4G125]QNI35303.1 hypothetical protein H7846_09325 [Edaphobacter sp. 4G125]